MNRLNKNKQWIKTGATVIITSLITLLAVWLIPQGIGDGYILISKNQYKVYKEYDEVFTIRDALYKNYDGNIDEKKLVEGATKGLAASLGDPYTVYMNKEEYKKFSESTQGEYAGIGVQIKTNDKNLIEVVSVFENSPAKKAKIQKGDVFMQVNDTTVSGDNTNEAISLMTGAVGKKVQIKLIREGNTVDVQLTTDKIVRNTIEGKIIENNIGKITIAEFDAHTSENLKTELKNLTSQGAKGILIDLRDNPGGLLDQVVKVCSQFIEKDKLLTYTIDKYNKKIEYKSLGGNYYNIPMVVLVNEGSASASEIFTGVMKDYNRATIIGATTFGKGIVQTIFETEGNTALKVTISKYYTPLGVNIHKKGIEPNIPVTYPKELLRQTYDPLKDPQMNKAIEVLKDKIK